MTKRFVGALTSISMILLPLAVAPISANAAWYHPSQASLSASTVDGETSAIVKVDDKKGDKKKVDLGGKGHGDKIGGAKIGGPKGLAGDHHGGGIAGFKGGGPGGLNGLGAAAAIGALGGILGAAAEHQREVDQQK